MADAHFTRLDTGITYAASLQLCTYLLGEAEDWFTRCGVNVSADRKGYERTYTEVVTCLACIGGVDAA